MSSDKFWSHFYEIYEAIPRQGPGDRESTERALRRVGPLTPSHNILDIGCGSGAQTIDLAQATQGQILAVDNHEPFISQLKKKAGKLGLEARILARVDDMNHLEFPDGSFDVIWSEGSIFIIGFAKGLSAWRRWLAPGGYMVVSEFCWLCDNPAEELREMFLDDGSDVGDVEARRNAIARSGYRLVDEFVLPEKGWWDNYYVPLGQCLERFRKAHVGDPQALEVAAKSQREIDLYQKHSSAYGYVFFVLQRD